MTDYDQGAYTPPGDRLAFDPREPVRSGPAPVTLIASALILVGLVGGVAFVYRHGFRHAGAAPAEVGAPVAQIKTPAPVDTSAAGGLSIDKTNATVAFAPPAEQPLPRGPEVAVAPTTTAAPPTPVAAPKTPAPAQSAPKPVTIASLTDAALAPKPPPKPVAKPAAPALAATATAGANWVQIGAFSSTSLAEKGWGDIASAAPGDMKGKGRKVEAVVAGGKTLYRAYVTGFASHGAAESFCGDLRALGKSCIVK